MNIHLNQIMNYNILDGMKDWVRVIDKGNKVIYANKSMRDDLGSCCTDSKCWKLINSGDQPCGECVTKKSALSAEVFTREEVIAGHYYSVKTSPILNKDNEVIAAVEVFRDITRERNLELELITKNRAMSSAVEFAKKIQERILPAEGVHNGINLKYLYKPSEMLSGDMFDLMRIDKSTLGLYISDVAGHGLAASMMTMFVRQTMRLILMKIKSPGIALSELNRRFKLLKLEPDKYFTCFYGIYNSDEKIFTYANAGHNSVPVVVRANGEIERLELKGYPISQVTPDKVYEEAELVFNEGDKLYLYTDGIIEATDKSGEEFGESRLIDVLKNSSNAIDELIKITKSYIYDFNRDDVALVEFESVDRRI